MAFKKNTEENFKKFTNQIEKTSNKAKVDERLYRLETDKAGNGYALIRFLPGLDDDTPFVKIYDHHFDVDGRYYVEKSLTTIGEDDPCGPMLKRLWASGLESDKKIAKKRGRKTNFYANILVIDDPLTPENNGKVFLFKYGPMIHEMVMDQVAPKATVENLNPVPCNPADAFVGKNFKYRLREKEVDGKPMSRVPDKSCFEDDTSPIKGDEAELERIYKAQYPLLPMIDPSEFKSYSELEQNLNKVLYGSPRSKDSSNTMDSLPDSAFPEKENSDYKASLESTVDDDDDELNAFKSMLEDDDVPY